MNTCRKCCANVQETLTGKTGHKCKKCVAEYNKAYREANKERIAAKKAEWKANNTEHVKRKDAEYAANNPDKRAAARKRWIERNPERNIESKKEWLRRNPDKRKAVNKAYAEANKECVRLHDANRKARKRSSTLPWLTEDHLWWMREIYALAIARTEATGVRYEVDHIIPLAGKTVCGLHVPWNLQVIPHAENRAKSNKLPPEDQLIGRGW
jgi:hypothetical protein